MPILPAFLQPLLAAYLQPILYWLNEWVYADLLKQAPDELLVKLQKHLDCAPIEQACAGYQHASGPGAPPTHSIACLVRATLVGALYHWSLRELEHQIRFNLIVKWFVGYAFFERGPDHCTLERFELWVCQYQHRTYFDTVLCQIDVDFPDDRQALQRGDTFAVRANAAREELGDLIGHTCQCALRALLAVAPDLQPQIQVQLQAPAVRGPASDPHAFRLNLAERARRLQTRVEAAQACAGWVQTMLATRANLSAADRASVTVWLQRLEKIWADELTFSTPLVAAIPQADPAAAVGLAHPRGPTLPGGSAEAQEAMPAPEPEQTLSTSASTAPALDPAAAPTPGPGVAPVETTTALTITVATHKGAYRLGSATDPEATYRVHGLGAEKTEFGYNTQLLTSNDFVRAIEAYTGACPDGPTLAPVLQAQYDHQGFFPAKLVYDSAAGFGKVYAQVAQATQGRTQLVAPLIAFDKRTDRFAPEAFELAPDGQNLTCPHGRTTNIVYRHGLAEEGRLFRFASQVCRDCPLWAQCRPHPLGSRAVRQVFISDYRPHTTAARAYALTATFTTEMRQRASVERLVAALVRYNGARRARRRGLRKTDFQMKQSAVAYNLKKWMRLLDLQTAAMSIPIPG